MTGAGWVLLLAMVLFATTLLMHRLIRGCWDTLRLPVSWFYVTWLIGLIMLAMPLFEYQERFDFETAAFLLAVLAAVSIGSIAASFWHRSPESRRRREEKVLGGIGTEDHSVSDRLVVSLLALGFIGTSLVLTNAVLGGSLSLVERLDSDNLTAIRAEHMTQTASRIGPLFGPAYLMSSIGGLGVAFAFYKRGARSQVGAAGRLAHLLALCVLSFNLVVGLIGLGSRMFSVFAVLVAFFAFVEGRWSIGEKLIKKRPTAKSLIFFVVSSLCTVTILWLSATAFLEARSDRQDPQSMLFRSHRATLAPTTYEFARHDKTLQYFLFSASYITTPIPTLTFYLDLPPALQPGPFLGEYNFPMPYRWGRRLTFNFDPFSWERARAEIFSHLGNIGFGMNVWSTMVRDLVADFGRIGALVFLSALGFLAQRLFDKQLCDPSARRAGLLVYLRIVLLFSGLVSMLFMAQIYWPLYLAMILVAFAKQRGYGKGARSNASASLTLEKAA